MRRRGCCGPLLLTLLFVLVAGAVLASLAAVLVIRGEVPIYAPRLTHFAPPPTGSFVPTTPISLTFDQPMDPASVQAALVLQPPMEGSFQWSADQTGVTFVPAGAGWAPGTTYTARLEAGAEAAMFARVTARPVTWSFSLPPLLRSVSPPADGGAVGALPRLEAEFNYDLDCDLTLRTFVVEPDVTGVLSCEARTVVFSATLPLEPGSAYAARLAHVFLPADPWSPAAPMPPAWPTSFCPPTPTPAPASTGSYRPPRR
ncbi:MAG: Ig-like domain-containing protein [Anaerolineae bacterium]